MLITQCNIMASPVREAVESKISFLFVFFHFYFFFLRLWQGNHKGTQKKKKQGGKPVKSPSATYHGNQNKQQSSSWFEMPGSCNDFFPLLFQVVFLLYESINKHWESSKMKRIRSIKWICYLDTHRDVCWDMTDIDLSVEITKLMRARHCNIYH